MNDALENLIFYQKSMQLYEACWEDCETLFKDFRGKEVARQLIRSCGSISANIEEGYGRGFGKEYPQFLRISRGSARESRGWYIRGKKLLNQNLVDERVSELNGIIAMLSKTIKTLEEKNKKG